MIDLILIWLGMKAARKYEENTRLMCAECGSEQAPGATFCGACGKQALVLPSQFRKIQDKHRDAEIADLNVRQRRNLAIERIQKLTAATVCGNCHIFFDDHAAFCTTCGANLSGSAITDDLLFQIAQTEFPDVCQTWDEFLALKNATPEKGVTRGLLGRNLAKLIREQGIGSIE